MDVQTSPSILHPPSSSAHPSAIPERHDVPLRSMVAPLSRSDLFARISPADLKPLLEPPDLRSFRQGQLIFQRGDPGDGLYAVVSGRVRVFIEDGDGNEAVVAIRGPGDVLGEMSLLDGMPRSASASAQEAVKAVRITPQRFESWLMEHPRAAYALLQELARRVRQATEQLAELSLLDVETRVARRLWQIFVEAFATPEPSPGSSLRVNQSELAGILGVTRESVNKHLGRLKSRGIIGTGGGNVELLRPDELRALGEVL